MISSGTESRAYDVAGGLLPRDLLDRIDAGDKDIPGIGAGSYGLQAGESVRRYASRSWAYLIETWREFRRQLDAAPAGRHTELTRQRWLLILLRELGFDRAAPTPAGGIPVDGVAYPVSHTWQDVPVHLLGWDTPLDVRSKGVAGAAGAAPQSLVQRLLNVSDRHLWALLSNGSRLRLLRDSTSLAGSAYLEFDLESIFDGELYSDFVLLYLTCHSSRFVPQDEQVGPASCWLETWRSHADEQGVRALEQLRSGVEEAIRLLGSGFLDHHSNSGLRDLLRSGTLHIDDLNRALLRAVYRLLFWFVAEDRGVLLDPDGSPDAAGRYREFYSSGRLRRLALKLHGSRHHDLWEGVRLVFDALGTEGGCPPLGLPGIGGLFEPGPLDEPLAGARLPNHALLGAVRALAVVTDRDGGGRRRTVDFRNLGSEELGSVYEGLLELHPGYDPDERRYTLERLAGHERKTTGSYYTPSSLVELLLDTTLDPLLDRAEGASEPVAALLDVTVCDPACGSGHFLIAAARRIARRVAAAESGELEPPPDAVGSALRRVVSRCIYGVDVNPMATELAKVTLWLEAMEPGRPLAFLDANIRVGNSLLGVTPKLLAGGIPDDAYKPLEGDDRRVVASLKKQNSREKQGEHDLFGGISVANVALAKESEAIAHAPTPRSLADVHVQERRARELETSPERRRLRLVADAWCAAFVQPKTEQTRETAITQGMLERLQRGESGPGLEQVRETVDDLARDYRFFHWHLEFPHIFRVPEANQVDPDTGWTGGFTCVIGNPPWERVKLQEQEFFASRHEEIASAGNAAARKKLIAALSETDPPLAAAWAAAQRRSDGVSHLLRGSGRYPLCGVGDVNTYAVFAEHFRTVIASAGRMGIITPTGLATDATTAAFFADALGGRRLAAFYDFENEAKIFPNVTNRFRFAVTCLTGGERVDQARLAFVVRHVADVPARRFALAPEEVLLLNPNTGTLPLFRSRTDAEITVRIYRRHPVLIRDGDKRGNPWGLRFGTIYHMANDSGLFRTAGNLTAEGASFDGWAWSKGEQRWLPLYEAKLLSHYDHRFSTYANANQGQISKGTLPHLSDGQHDDPSTEPLARYWLSDFDVADAIRDHWHRDWLLGFRRLTRYSDLRTFVPTVLPLTAVGDNTWLVWTRPENTNLLQVVWSSLLADYLIRQKLSGTTLSAYIVEQLACPTPETFNDAQPWSGEVLREWVVPRVVELSYTSWRIRPYAVDNGDDGPPFRWLPERRELIRAELDAAMFHVYGLTRPEVEHVLDSFFVVRKYEERDHGEFRTKRLVLDRYDAMADAARTGHPYQTILDPPPGQGPRHPSRG